MRRGERGHRVRLLSLLYAEDLTSRREDAKMTDRKVMAEAYEKIA